MLTNKVKIAAVSTASVVSALLLVTGCGNKANESSQDSGINARDTSGAEILNFPDGFTNVATKCSHGDRVFVAFHNDGSYASIAVVGQDPTCPKG